MIKVIAIEEFTLKEFDKLNNIVRKDRDEEGRLFVGDIFECDEEMYYYLRGGNKLNKVVIEPIGVNTENINVEQVKDITEAPVEDELTEEENKEIVEKKKNKKNRK